MALPLPFIFAAVTVVFVAYKLYTKPRDRYLSQLPQPVTRSGWFGATKGILINSLGDVGAIIDIGYEKFSKLNLPFYLTGIHSNYVILPPQDVKWISEQPEHLVSAKEEQKSSLQSDWIFLDKAIGDFPLHETVIRRDMTRQIAALIPEVEEELDTAMSDYWGTNTEEWKDICVFEGMMKVISRATNRVLVGAPLCRNEDYLANCRAFTGDLALSGPLLRLFPDFVKPIIAPIILLPTKYHVRNCAKHLTPIIKSRIASPSTSPEDFLTWSIREAASSPNAALELATYKLVLRIMTVNFAAIHTSTFTVTNLILDFFSSPTVASDIEILRSEVEQVYAANGNKWDKASVAKLVRTDSALRESMRMSTFMTHGMDRIITAPDGVTTPSGLHVAQGTRVGTATFAIHHDDDKYPDAQTYKPFRFSDARETVTSEQSLETNGKNDSTDSLPSEKTTHANLLASKNMAAITTSDSFLAFGHGKHACPGRFFASAEIKLMLAYIIMNYDVQPLLQRPKNQVIAGTIIPPMKAGIKVRRRKNARMG